MNNLRQFINDGRETHGLVKTNESKTINEGFKVDDVVYNTRTKTIGIVRMEEERGEVKTDADGNVDVDELEKYNPMKYKHQEKADIAPSTKKEIEKRKLFKPFSLDESEEINEASFPEQKKAIQQLENLLKAMKELSDSWTEDSTDFYHDNLTKDYPFAGSFDDLTYDATTWVKESIKRLKKAQPSD